MKHFYLIIIIILIDFYTINAQENIISIFHPDIKEDTRFKPFKDENGDWGIIDSKNNKVITTPQYKLLGDFISDSFYIFVDKNNNYGVINSDGTQKVPFNYYGGSLGINRIDTTTFYKSIQVIPYKVYGQYPYKDLYVYFIDSNGYCIPTNYYTCPTNVKTDLINATPGVIYIQKAEKSKIENDLDSAIYYCKMAIESDSLNPYYYYYGCKLLLVNEQNNINAKNNNNYKQYFNWLESCLLKAENLEKNPHYLYRIKSLKCDFYKYDKIDKLKVESLKADLDLLKKEIRKAQYPEMWLYHY